MATPYLLLEFTGGEGQRCHSDLCFVVKFVPHQINISIILETKKIFWICSKSKPVAGSQFLGGTTEKFSKGEVFILKNW